MEAFIADRGWQECNSVEMAKGERRGKRTIRDPETPVKMCEWI